MTRLLTILGTWLTSSMIMLLVLLAPAGLVLAQSTMSGSSYSIDGGVSVIGGTATGSSYNLFGDGNTLAESYLSGSNYRIVGSTVAFQETTTTTSSGGGGGGGGSSRQACNDNKDNDGDGLTDEDDPGCHSDGNPDNPDSYDRYDDDEFDTTIDILALIELLRLLGFLPTTDFAEGVAMTCRPLLTARPDNW